MQNIQSSNVQNILLGRFKGYISYLQPLQGGLVVDLTKYIKIFFKLVLMGDNQVIVLNKPDFIDATLNVIKTIWPPSVT